MPLASKSVKNVKYFASSAFPPTFASICRTYMKIGIPAPNPREYFVSWKIHEKKKHIEIDAEYFTDLDPEEIDADEIIGMYHNDRWDIETAYDTDNSTKGNTFDHASE